MAERGRALEEGLQDESLGPLERAALLSDLANLSLSDGKTKEAEELLHKAMELRKEGEGGGGGAGTSAGGGGDGEKSDSSGGGAWDDDDDDWEANLPKLKSAEELGREKAEAEAAEKAKKAALGAPVKVAGVPGVGAGSTAGVQGGAGEGGAAVAVSAVPEDGHHCLELFDFDPELTTTDLERMLARLPVRGGTGPSLKWVDDTHALAVFPTASAASSALRAAGNIPLRPWAEASTASRSVPLSDLRPPVPRPKTNSSVARRLIGGALGMPELSRGTTEAARKENDKLREHRKEAKDTRSKAKEDHKRAEAAKEEVWGDD